MVLVRVPAAALIFRMRPRAARSRTRSHHYRRIQSGGIAHERICSPRQFSRMQYWKAPFVRARVHEFPAPWRWWRENRPPSSFSSLFHPSRILGTIQSKLLCTIKLFVDQRFRGELYCGRCRRRDAQAHLQVRNSSLCSRNNNFPFDETRTQKFPWHAYGRINYGFSRESPSVYRVLPSHSWNEIREFRWSFSLSWSFLICESFVQKVYKK